MQGRRKEEQVAGPRGRVWEGWMLGGDPPLDSCRAAEEPPVQYPTDSQAVPRARWLCFQTSAFPQVARSNSFILGEQSA